MRSADQPAVDRAGALRRWGRRVGVVGFLFFLVKGLLWLAVPFAIALCADSKGGAVGGDRGREIPAGRAAPAP